MPVRTGRRTGSHAGLKDMNSSLTFHGLSRAVLLN